MKYALNWQFYRLLQRFRELGIKITKKTLVKIAGYGSVVMAIFFIITAGYIYVIIQDLKHKIDLASVEGTDIVQAPSTFEQETQVNRSLFEDYLLFSGDAETKKSLDALMSEDFMTRVGGELAIHGNFDLPALRVNNCDRYRCLQNRRKFTDIPASVWKGLLGTEDFRFLEHQGVDPIAIARAIVVDIIAMKFVQGGSTLTQQLVKNLFLTNERKLKRKFIEIVYALYIENILSKEEIITLYLNEVFWGTFQGVYLKGFHAASLAYFNKVPADLDEFEATILIGLLKGPSYYDPSRGIDRIKERTKAVYQRLKGLGLVSQSEEYEWSDEDWKRWKKDFDRRAKKRNLYSYYLASQNSDTTLESFEKLVLYQAVGEVEEYLKPRVRDADIGIKILIADVNCKSFDCESSFSYYSKLQRDKRAAMTTERHQVGSLLKPIVYETLVELGKDYDDSISTEPITLNLKSGSWTPKDYSKVKVDEIELRVALQKSKNIPLVRAASEVGFDKLEEKLDPLFPRLKKPLGEFPAQLLGALELTMEEVLKTYSDFIENKCRSIVDDDVTFEDTVLFYMSQAPKTTISNLAKSPLRDALVFGKTGTTNKGLDNWYYAFDGKKVYLIWYGVESNRDKFDLRLSGAVSSFLIFQKFMNSRGKQISEIICSDTN